MGEDVACGAGEGQQLVHKTFEQLTERERRTLRKENGELYFPEDGSHEPPFNEQLAATPAAKTAAV